MKLNFKKVGLLIVFFTTLSITGCSTSKSKPDMEKEIINSMKELDSNGNVDIDSNNANGDSGITTNSVDPMERTGEIEDKVDENITIAPIKQKEVSIYSIDENTLDIVSVVALISEDTVLTPEIVVDMVVDSFEDRLIIIGIDSITVENDAVIVSFKKDQAPLYNTGSSVETGILDAIAQSIVDNIKEYPKVIFRVEGEAYVSGHMEFKIDEVYLDNTKS